MGTKTSIFLSIYAGFEVAKTKYNKTLIKTKYSKTLLVIIVGARAALNLHLHLGLVKEKKITEVYWFSARVTDRINIMVIDIS